MTKPRDPRRFLAPFCALVLPLLVFFALLVLTRTIYRADITPSIAIAPAEEPLTPLLEVEPPPPEVQEETHEIAGEPFEDLHFSSPEFPTVASLTPDAPTLDPMPSPTPFQPNAVDLIPSPVTMKTMAGAARSGLARASALSRFGGGEGGVEGAILRGLRWLKAHQQPDGTWEAKGEGDPTAFALLAFLSHGETVASPEFGPTVKKALQALMKGKHTSAMAVYALCEAAAVMKTPVVKDVAEQALEALCARQKTLENANRGGIVSRFFVVMALKAGMLAGLQAEGTARVRNDLTAAFMRMRDGKDGQGARIAGKGTWHFMIAGVCLQYLGAGESTETRQMLRRLDELWQPATLGKTAIACCPVRSNYFATILFFNAGGEEWARWNAGMRKAYETSQTLEGSTGFWRCQDEHIGDQPFWPTCYLLHQLMVYYRYLPTYLKQSDPPECEKAVTPPEEENLGVDIEVEI